MDKRIQRLVIFLNTIDGVKTFGSCEGHPGGIGINNGNGYHVPYVMFKVSSMKIVENLRKILLNFRLLKSTWSINSFAPEKMHFSLTVGKTSDYSLENAWEDINVLCDVFENKIQLNNN